MDLQSIEPRTMFPAGTEIHNARYACSAFIAGQSVDWVVRQFEMATPGSGETTYITEDEARKFIPVAIKYYCPQVHP
jgi:Protein of unknown function (DUF732)